MLTFEGNFSEVWMQTCDLRVVDVSSNPQMRSSFSIQQAWREQTTGKIEWRPIPFAGHIMALKDCPKARLDEGVIRVR